MNTLSDEVLEAVLAHELTHIRNKDVRLLVIAVVFVGIFSFVGEIAFRGLWHTGGGIRTRRSSRDSGGGAIIAIVAALAMIAIAYALAIVIRFALSRRREYLADAGAVELTKNPDAMISALQKISGNSAVTGGGQEGSGSFGVGIAVDVRQRYRIDLKYVGFYSDYSKCPRPGTSPQPGTCAGNAGSADVYNGTNALISDRDFISLTIKTTS